MRRRHREGSRPSSLLPRRWKRRVRRVTPRAAAAAVPFIPSQPPPKASAALSGLLRRPGRVKLRPIPSSSSYSPSRCSDAAAAPLASGLLQPPLYSSPAFSFVDHQYRYPHKTGVDGELRRRGGPAIH